MTQEDKQEESKRQIEQSLDRCAKCSDNANCQKYQNVLFLMTHEDETQKAVEESAEPLRSMLALLVAKSPILILVDQGSLTSFIKVVFMMGYARGRKFPTVPEVYIRECPDGKNISS